MRLLLGAALAWLLAGCGGRQPGETHKLAERPASAAKELAIRTVDAAGLASEVRESRGRVVLVDFWATWCQPCLKLFPHAVDLERRFGPKGLTVITVSLDEPNNAAAVERFLRRQLAGKGAESLRTCLGSYGVGSEAFTAFDISDGALPHVKIFGRDGRLLRSFASGGEAIDPRKIEAAVTQALK